MLRRAARMLRIMAGILSISLQRDLAYRAEIFVRLGLSVLTSVGALVSLGAVYSHVHTLAGWTFGEAVLVAGVFMIVNGLLLTFVEPNLEWFAEKLRTGMLDDVLVRPVSSMFLTSFATSRPWSLVDALIGVVVAGIGLRSLEGSVTAEGVLAGHLPDRRRTHRRVGDPLRVRDGVVLGPRPRAVGVLVHPVDARPLPGRRLRTCRPHAAHLRASGGVRLDLPRARTDAWRAG